MKLVLLLARSCFPVLCLLFFYNSLRAASVAPALRAQPVDQTYYDKDYVFYDATAYVTGTGAFYTWTKDGKSITTTSAGQSNAAGLLIFYPASPADTGTYIFTASNDYGSVTSNPFKITVQSNPFAPQIITQPISLSVTPGSPATFTVRIRGEGGIYEYQWYKDGVAIPYANDEIYAIPSAALSDAGSYSVYISYGGYYPVSSSAATLSVGEIPQTRVVNLSTRANVGTGANVLIAGFIINGSTPKQMLIRALGPTLSNYSVKNPLPDPTLKIVDGAGNTVATNDDWQTASNIDDFNGATTETKAVPLPAGSKDAGLVTTLNPGAYTALVSGKAGASGVALVELYEVDTNTINQLVNISSRANVGTGEAVTIAGIIVSGSVPKKFLVRAIGPGLQSRGVPGFLADPQFQIVDASNKVVAMNDNWETSDTLAEINAVTTQVNAVPLGAGSKDAALAVTLAPGGYTVIVRGTGGTSGVALVEAYQAP